VGFFKALKSLILKENQIDKTLLAILLIKIMILNGGRPTFVWKPQETKTFWSEFYFIIKKLS
jgi:hypothetical protein